MHIFYNCHEVVMIKVSWMLSQEIVFLLQTWLPARTWYRYPSQWSVPTLEISAMDFQHIVQANLLEMIDAVLKREAITVSTPPFSCRRLRTGERRWPDATWAQSCYPWWDAVTNLRLEDDRFRNASCANSILIIESDGKLLCVVLHKKKVKKNLASWQQLKAVKRSGFWLVHFPPH